MAAPVILVASVDRTEDIAYGSLVVDQALTSQADTCQFAVVRHPGRTWEPAVGAVVRVTESGTKIFEGLVTAVEKLDVGYPMSQFQVSCTDYTRFLKRKLVAETYEGMTVNAIIADMVAKFGGDGITATNVDCPVTIDYIQFNYEPFDQCLKRLADATAYDWYIDYDKAIHFFLVSGLSAPVDITDTNGSYVAGSLSVRKDSTQQRNTVIVRGGQYLGDTVTADFEGDGTTDTWALPYRYDHIRTVVTGSEYNIGIDFSSDPLAHDLMWNRDEKTIRFRATKVPTTGSAFSVFGQPYLPVLVKVRDWAAIGETVSAEGGSGQYEYLVVDQNINSKEGARMRALAELYQFASALTEGELDTETPGFEPGQSVLVNSASLGVNRRLIVSRVRYACHTPTTFRYHLTLISTKSLDYITVMRRILAQQTRQQVINQKEAIDLIESADEEITIDEDVVATTSAGTSTAETITVGESSTTQALNYGVRFPLQDQSYAPSTIYRAFQLDGSIFTAG